jgi:hypothetical protein
MLNGITWGQFTVFMVAITGSYYLYVFLRFYALEIFGRMKYKALRASEGGGVENDGGNDSKGKEAATAPPANQVELFEQERRGGGGDEQFQVMQRAIGVIRQVIAQGIENKLDRENILDHIRQVLGDFRKLRKTEYAETINNFLIRTCKSELSLELGEAELAELRYGQYGLMKRGARKRMPAARLSRSRKVFLQLRGDYVRTIG